MKPELYDLHRHVWPASFVEALRARREPPCLDGWLLRLADGEYELEPDLYGPERCLAELDRDGVAVTASSCQPTLGVEELPQAEAEELRAAWHEGALALAAESGGRIVPFAADRPREGFVGVCVGAGALADLDALAPVLSELEQSGGLLFVHPGLSPVPAGAPGWWAAGIGYTAQMQEAYAWWLARGLERWPRLRVLFALLAGGGAFQLERFASRGFDPRQAQASSVFFDVSSYGRRAIEHMLSALGGERLVFGSDGPVLDPRTSLAAVRGFGQAVTDVICRDNPRGLLHASGNVP